jgi:alkanesulfonate monooxygenase SsuD/methylene tetrahydromethanopterin reductase-like flavin-dependent oxidoreductase (luciferase family)
MTIGFSVFTMPIEDILAIGRHAEGLGFDNAWVGEHVFAPTHLDTPHPYSGRKRDPVQGSDQHIYDLWVMVGALIGAAPKLTVSTGIAITPLRHPLITARAALTAHQMSRGKFRLGIGVGWMAQEFDALGVPFKERAARTEEIVEILRRVFAGGHVEHTGRFYAFPLTQMTEKPASIPIIFGGTAPAAVRRAALMGDGWYSPFIDLEKCVEIRHDIERIRAEAGLGDKPFSYHVRPTTRIDRDVVAKYRDAGFDNLGTIWEMIHPEDSKTTTLDFKLQALDRCAAAMGLKP